MIASTMGAKVRPEYVTWGAMIQRCTNPKRPFYHLYGGRGITVCQRWRTFSNFLADMGPRAKGTTIDRLNPNGNYEPGNCRWATPTEQGRNKRGSALACCDCGRDDPPFRRGRCHRCNEFLRRNGVAWTAAGTYASVRVGERACLNCGKLAKKIAKERCMVCYNFYRNHGVDRAVPKPARPAFTLPDSCEAFCSCNEIIADDGE